MRIPGSEKRTIAMGRTFADKRVTYTLSHNGRLYIVESAPARVCNENGEEFFQQETVEHIQNLVKGASFPKKTLQTPVSDYH
jgi:YgiT-type zinc finger domain-containing protein